LRKSDSCTQPMPRVFLVEGARAPETDHKECLQHDDLVVLPAGIIQQLGAMVETRFGLVAVAEAGLDEQLRAGIGAADEEHGVEQQGRDGTSGIGGADDGAVDDGEARVEPGEVGVQDGVARGGGRAGKGALARQVVDGRGAAGRVVAHGRSAVANRLGDGIAEARRLATLRVRLLVARGLVLAGDARQEIGLAEEDDIFLHAMRQVAVARRRGGEGVGVAQRGLRSGESCEGIALTAGFLLGEGRAQ